VCYYGASPDTVYDNLGHAEVTQVILRGSEQQRNEQVLVPRTWTLFAAGGGLFSCLAERGLLRAAEAWDGLTVRGVRDQILPAVPSHA
jgi:hypothetical protein